MKDIDVSELSNIVTTQSTTLDPNNSLKTGNIGIDSSGLFSTPLVNAPYTTSITPSMWSTNNDLFDRDGLAKEILLVLIQKRGEGYIYEDIAIEAYALADAMKKARDGRI